jgi:iron complex transport system ATP-binding protein
MDKDQILLSLKEAGLKNTSLKRSSQHAQRSNAQRKPLGPFSIDIKCNERIAILGPSGAGKSSLLQIMSGLHEHAGNIEFLSKPLKQMSVQELSCKRAFLAQHHEIAFNLSSELIISLGRVARERDPELIGIIQESAKAARAEHLLGRSYQTLSGGEKARVHLARIFAQLWDQQNGIMLVDEPLAALDPGLQIELLLSILRFCKDRSHAVVAILHDIQQAIEHFERLVLIKDGKIMADLPSNPAPQRELEYLYGMKLERFSRPGRKDLLIPSVLGCSYST